MALRPEGSVTEDEKYADIRKVLFQSPRETTEDARPVTPSTSGQSSQVMDALMSRLQIEHDEDASAKLAQKELHEQRLKDIRRCLQTLEETNWQYKSADKLIGLQ